jgi:hypothetical protein
MTEMQELEKKIQELEMKVKKTQEISLKYDKKPCSWCSYDKTFDNNCYLCYDSSMHTDKDIRRIESYFALMMNNEEGLLR